MINATKTACVLALLSVLGFSDGFTTSSASPRTIKIVQQQRHRSLGSLIGGDSSNNIVSKRSSTTNLYSSSDGDVTIIDRDFRVAGFFLAFGLLLDTIPYIQLTLGPLVTVLGILFLVQTFRLSFVCDETSFSLQNTVQESGENIIVGGENKWPYKAFVNYDFFPKGWIDQPQGPILVYFKENQTPSDKWNDGPGAKANSEEAIANGAVPGQVHFFPAICSK
jgi:hypothetical protein